VCAGATAFETTVAWSAESRRDGGYYLHAFKSRLTDPHIGDKVGVCLFYLAPI